MELRSFSRASTPAAASRREFLRLGGRFGLGLGALSLTGRALAAALDPVEVAYAGSMGSVMEGAVKQAVAQSLHLELRGHGQGASALAQLIAGGSLHPDVFVSVTPGPMELVLRAGKAAGAVPVAATRMVIAWSPGSRFAPQFEAARAGKTEWWRVLESPGLRFGRSDPATDPQGRNIIFTMMLAAKAYGQPDLVNRILGPLNNPQQISMEASVQSRLQAGQLDAASAYRMQPAAFHLPFLELPAGVDLRGTDVHAQNPEISLQAGGKTWVPEPLVFYAAALKGAKNPVAAEAFVRWLAGTQGQRILHAAAYDAPGTATPLRA